MPFKNYYSARIKSPKSFDHFTYQNKGSNTGVEFVLGWNKDKSEIQSIRFKKSKWDKNSLKDWLEDHKFKYMFIEEYNLKTFSEYIKEGTNYETEKELFN